MRMTASWFGFHGIHRIQGCGATFSARWQAPPRTGDTPVVGKSSGTCIGLSTGRQNREDEKGGGINRFTLDREIPIQGHRTTSSGYAPNQRQEDPCGSPALKLRKPEADDRFSAAAASPELLDRPRRRTFTAQDKLRILGEVDRAAGIPGAVGAIVRREGLYSSALSDWRRQRAAGASEALSPAKRAQNRRTKPAGGELALSRRDTSA